MAEVWRHAKLPENLIAIEVVPYFDNLAIGNAEPAVSANQDLLPGGRHSIAFAGVRPSGNPIDDDEITFHIHAFDRHVQVRSSQTPSFAFGYGLFQPGIAVAEIHRPFFCRNLLDKLGATA